MATVKFYIRDYLQKGKLRTDEVRIIARITKSRTERFEIRTEEKVQPKYWDNKNQQVKSSCRDHYEINAALQEFRSKIHSLYRDNKHLSFQQFKQLAQEKPNTEKKTLFLALSQFIEVSNSEKDSKTVAKFITLEKHLKKFDALHPIDLDKLDFNFYDRFKAYLYAIPNQFYLKYSLVNRGDHWELEQGDHGEPVGIFDDQVFAYFRQMKTFLKWAEKREYKVHSSYKNWKTIRRVHDPITLTFDELHKLERHIYTSNALDVARDYLVMECRTGQRISDIKRIHLKDFSSAEYTLTPRKGNRLSNKKVTIYFSGYCANALTILSKHNGKLPQISEQKLNGNIKRACKEAGIDSDFHQFRWAGNKRVKFTGPKYEFISSHVGRKTCITLMLQSGIPLDIVMEFVGINDEKTIKYYRGKFEGKKMHEYLEGVEQKALMRKAK
jgi:integrase